MLEADSVGLCFLQALTIAIRYAAVRRQFSTGGNPVRHSAAFPVLVTTLTPYASFRLRRSCSTTRFISDGSCLCWRKLSREDLLRWRWRSASSFTCLPHSLPYLLSLEPRRMFTELTEALETLEPNDPNLEEVLSKLKETHATSAGLKGGS